MLQNFSADPMELREGDYENVRIAYMRWQVVRVL